MSDLVERLRALNTADTLGPYPITMEAADEIERLRALPRLATMLAKDAEIERLCEQVAALQASSGYEASIAQVKIERLTADNHRLMMWNEQLQADLDTARRALDPHVREGMAD